MIKKLTKKQEEKLKVYRDKWLQIGLSTEQISFDETKNIIDSIYTHLLIKETVPVIVLENPYKTWVAVQQYVLAKNQVEGQVRNQVEGQVRNQVEGQVGDQVRNQVVVQVGVKVWDQVRNQVGVKVWDQVGVQVRNQVGVKVWDQVRSQENLIDFVYPYLEGNLMSSYFSFYDYCLIELDIKIEENFMKNFEVYKESSKLSLIYPFDDVCFVCEKPIEIHFNKNKLLHNSTGPSIKYKGDWNLYHLNGVRVTEEIINVKPNKISVDMVLKEKNVEIRRELLRKLGINNFIKKLKVKPIEKSKDKIYELYKFKIGENIPATYLKMINPSTNDIHFEGISNDCHSIEESLAWRDSEYSYIKPIKLT